MSGVATELNVGEVRRVQELVEELRKAGVVPRGYEIISPYERLSLDVWRDLLGFRSKGIKDDHDDE